MKRLWLHTCNFDDPQALPFYMHMGFVPYARAVEVHDDVRLLKVGSGRAPVRPFYDPERTRTRSRGELQAMADVRRTNGTGFPVILWY